MTAGAAPPGAGVATPPDHFDAPLAEADPEVAAIIAEEGRRQRDTIDLIASENLVSRAVLEAQGSCFTNKTVEGYPGRRYHGGADLADALERLAVARACRLFGARFANLQPHSGSQANLAVFKALLEPGDVVLSMALDAGGHLSHGTAVNLSGQVYKAVQYGVDPGSGLIDYDAVLALARRCRPRLIVAGGSAYPRAIDFAAFRRIADAVGARLLVDMAHFAGLVAGGVHPDPVPHADVVTSTSYKSLRGARGGFILTNDEALARRIDQAVFPGVQGSPMLHALAGKAVCLGEALMPAFREYAARVLANAQELAAALVDRGQSLVTGGTDTPLLLVDLRPRGLTGKAAAESLERAGIACNKNAVPGDLEKPTIASGLRLGVSAVTARGFGPEDLATVGGWIAEVLDALSGTPSDLAAVEAAIRSRAGVLARTHRFYAA